MGNNYCSFGVPQQELLIGSPRGGTTPVTQSDNSTQFDGNVTVNCSVTNGFDVVLTGSLGGTMGGTLQISGTVSASSGGMNIVASFTQNGTSYSENDCSIVFTYEGGMVPTAPPIADGRIWAHLNCPSMVNPSTPKLLSNNMQVEETCDGQADFLFDNCTQ
jgi:hypothetical protein